MIPRFVALIALLSALGLSSCSDPVAHVAATDSQAPSTGDSGQSQFAADTSRDPLAARDALAASDRDAGRRSVGQVRVMSWNLEWFFDDQRGDNFSRLANEQSAPNRAAWNWKRDAVAASIAAAAPDIAGLQEVEGRRAVWYLSRALLRNHDLSYAELSLEGADVFTEQDVGFVYRASHSDRVIQPLRQSIFRRSVEMIRSDRYEEVSKHLAVEFEVRLGDAVEQLTVVNVHLRAGGDARAVRIKQARSVHAWVADRIAAGANVIVLGDFNTDTDPAAVPSPPGSDLAAASGKETATEDDDLVDLHQYLARDQRQTHLLRGKAMDRILVSPSLLRDDPERIDLSFEKLERLKELAVRGDVDSPEEHFDRYWAMDAAERDISDHWPLVATFRMR